MAAIEGCEALIFVGTSFSVTITNLALAEARARNVPVYNFNLHHALNGAGRRYPVFNILGPAEANLPALLAIVERERERERQRAAQGAAAAPGPPVALLPQASGKRARSPDAAEAEVEEQEQEERGEEAAWAEDGGRAAAEAPMVGVGEDGAGRDDDYDDAAAAAAAAAAATAATPPSSSSASVEPHFAFLPSPPLVRPLPLSHVLINFQPLRFNRRAHPDTAVEEALDATWDALVAAAAKTGSTLFTASKFRFAGCSMRQQEHEEEEKEEEEEGGDGGVSLVLHLGLTDYKAFKSLDASASVAARLQADGERDLGDPAAYLSQKLGVSAVVVTADDHVVLIRRSLRGVAVCPGMIDTPGGHPEPANVTGLEETEGGGGRGEAILAEVFGSAAAEVSDEVNIPREALGPPQLLGLVRQLNCGGCPSAAFLIPCSLSAAAVRSCYEAGAREAAESTELLLIGRAHLPAFVRDLGTRLAPAAEGSLALYQRLCK
jgi:hypothetical protein